MSVKLGKYGMTSTKLAKFEYIQIGERKMVSFISVYIYNDTSHRTCTRFFFGTKIHNRPGNV